MSKALIAGVGLGLGLLAASGAIAASVDTGSWSLGFGGGDAGSPGGGGDAGDENLAAFLMAIRTFESNTNDSAFYMLNGGGRAATLQDHPANLGWPGRPLSPAECRAAGLGAGCVSTAAGAFQNIKPTWNRVARKLGVTDFSPASQIAVNVEIIRENGALDDVRSGNVVSALNKLAHVWASIAGNGAGQRQHSVSAWLTAYANNGGTLA